MGTTTGRLPFRRRQLARLLTKMRIESGLTQDEVARPLRFSEAKMSRIEHGQLPDFLELQALLDRYGVPVDQWPQYITLWERAGEKGWWHAYGLADKGYVSMEDEASMVRVFQLSFVPGLLQTERYTRAIFEQSVMPNARKEAGKAISIRAKRQERLFAEEPLALHALIDETVLHRRLKDPRIMREQLCRIVERAALPTVRIQVLPESAGLHHGLHGSFIVLSFPDEADPDLAYVEHIAGSVHIEADVEVRRCRVAFEHLSSLALSPEKSLALIEQVASEL